MVQIPGNGGVILKTPCNVSAGDERASCNVQRDLIRLGRVCRGSFKALSIVTVRLNLRLVNYYCRYDTVSSGLSLTASLTATSDSIRGLSSFHLGLIIWPAGSWADGGPPGSLEKSSVWPGPACYGL
ncbi:unnamed protein product [Prunus armeniaca]|uniref:Uncharacterized protein n=1 Tax=Prunus armeniaca TaxID=36596 RepID=A0A6J5U613_PRUAR|nr:unnamed protein product [Prunus armeniaca]